MRLTSSCCASFGFFRLGSLDAVIAPPVQARSAGLTARPAARQFSSRSGKQPGSEVEKRTSASCLQNKIRSVRVIGSTTQLRDATFCNIIPVCSIRTFHRNCFYFCHSPVFSSKHLTQGKLNSGCSDARNRLILFIYYENSISKS